MKKIMRSVAVLVVMMSVMVGGAVPVSARLLNHIDPSDCARQGGTVVPVFGNGNGSAPTSYNCELPDTSGSGGSGSSGSGTNNPACEGAILQVACDDKGGGIFAVLNLVLNILTAGVVVAATAGVIFAALRYTQARDNAESMAGAKKMIYNIIIGLAVWAVFWVLLQWLLPGGIF